MCLLRNNCRYQTYNGLKKDNCNLAIENRLSYVYKIQFSGVDDLRLQTNITGQT